MPEELNSEQMALLYWIWLIFIYFFCIILHSPFLNNGQHLPHLHYRLMAISAQLCSLFNLSVENEPYFFMNKSKSRYSFSWWYSYRQSYSYSHSQPRPEWPSAGLAIVRLLWAPVKIIFISSLLSLEVLYFFPNSAYPSLLQVYPCVLSHRWVEST